jgi:hypothetical protein
MDVATRVATPTIRYRTQRHAMDVNRPDRRDENNHERQRTGSAVSRMRYPPHIGFTSSVELPPNIKQLQPTFLRLGDLGRVNRLNIVERT